MEETKFLLALFSVIRMYNQNITMPFVRSVTHIFRLCVYCCVCVCEV